MMFLFSQLQEVTLCLECDEQTLHNHRVTGHMSIDQPWADQKVKYHCSDNPGHQLEIHVICNILD